MLEKLRTLLKAEHTEENRENGVSVALSDLTAMKRFVRLLSFDTRGVSRSEGFGQHRSPFRGRGMEFDEVRSYHAGDDVRLIDWRVTARTGKPYTKLYREERDRPVLFLGDFRSFMKFGTRKAFKSVVAAKALAALAWASRENGDKIGALIVSSDGFVKVAPHRQMRRLMEVFNAAVSACNDLRSVGGEPALSDVLAELRRVSKTGGRVFVLSDFHDFDADSEKHLAAIGAHCDTVCVQIFDPLEADPPPSGTYRVSDGQNIMTLPADDDAWRAAYTRRFETARKRVSDFCLAHKMLYVPVRTDDDLIRTLRSALFERKG